MLLLQCHMHGGEPRKLAGGGFRKDCSKRLPTCSYRPSCSSFFLGGTWASSPRDRQKQQTHFCPEGLSPGLVPPRTVPGRKHNIPETPGKPLSLPRTLLSSWLQRDIGPRDLRGPFQPRPQTRRTDLQAFPGEAPTGPHFDSRVHLSKEVKTQLLSPRVKITPLLVQLLDHV